MLATGGEEDLIERIRRRVPSSLDAGLRLGIGDDAAIMQPAQGMEIALSCDQFVENIHFLADVHPPDAVGYKALARATSDLAAMGARPRFFLLSLLLPPQRVGEWLDGVSAGMARAARRLGLKLAGGDVARSTPPGEIAALNVTVVGEIERGRAIRRDGAREGDAIFVTGRLGAAQLGLDLILQGMQHDRRWRRLLAPHYYPALDIELGRWLARRRLASAMIDVSDGLSTDLDRLCRASGVGARIWAEKLPQAVVPAALRDKGFDALALALHGGEDYGLLFTVPKRLAARIAHNSQGKASGATGGHTDGARRGTSVTRIGEIVRDTGIILTTADGGAAPLAPRGWDHFRRFD